MTPDAVAGVLTMLAAVLVWGVLLQPTVRVDDSAFRAKLRRMRNESPQASAETVAEIGVLFLDVVAGAAPVATGRFKRAVQMARNDLARIAGLNVVALEPIDADGGMDRVRDLERQLERVQGQIEYWERLRDRNLAKSPKTARGKPPESWPSHRDILRRLRKLEKLERSAVQQLVRYAQATAGGESVLFIGARANAQSTSVRSLVTVRTKVYGGRGTVTRQGQAWTAEGVILEPHGRFVDKRMRLGARAKVVLQTSGARRVSKSWLDRVAPGGS